MSKNGYTPIQKAILEVLSDGRRHTRPELLVCLNDELAEPTNLQPHITAIRKKLPPSEAIHCINHHGIYYQHVRLLASAVDGRK